MKKIRLGIGTIFFLIFAMVLFPKNVHAETIYNTGVTLKNADNTAVLLSGGINHEEYNIAYNTGKIEFPFNASVAYNSMYTFSMTYYFWIPYNQSYQSFGLGSPELYVNYNGLHQQTINVSTFSNTYFDNTAIYARYKLTLSFTFSTNSAGTLYLAIPVSPARAIYGWQYGNVDLTSFGSNGSDNSQIITNNNYNTNRIIDNNWGNTNRIIENQNESTNKIIESNKACTKYDKSNVNTSGKLISSGEIDTSSNFALSDYIYIKDFSIDVIESACGGGTGCALSHACFYDSNKSLISCFAPTSTGSVSVPSSSVYFRYGSNLSYNVPVFSICGNGNQILNNAINNLNDSINDKNIDNAMDNGSEFFDNFNHDSHGLAGIITSPIRLLNALTTAQCSPLKFNLPFVHNEVTLACPRTMYESYFGVFFSLWQLITTGLITYNVCINIYHKIHMMQNPYSDRIEVLNL